jgi:hypothetical protein
MFIFNIHDSNIATAEFLVISAETTCWEIEENSQIFSEDFYLPLYFPACNHRLDMEVDLHSLFRLLVT